MSYDLATSPLLAVVQQLDKHPALMAEAFVLALYAFACWFFQRSRAYTDGGETVRTVLPESTFWKYGLVVLGSSLRPRTRGVPLLETWRDTTGWAAEKAATWSCRHCIREAVVEKAGAIERRSRTTRAAFTSA